MLVVMRTFFVLDAFLLCVSRRQHKKRENVEIKKLGRLWFKTMRNQMMYKWFFFSSLWSINIYDSMLTVLITFWLRNEQGFSSLRHQLSSTVQSKLCNFSSTHMNLDKSLFFFLCVDVMYVEKRFGCWTGALLLQWWHSLDLIKFFSSLAYNFEHENSMEYELTHIKCCLWKIFVPIKEKFYSFKFEP